MKVFLMTKPETNHKLIFTTIWKSIVALLVASLSAGLCLLSVVFFTEERINNIAVGDVLKGVGAISLMIMILTGLPVIILEIFGRYFGWRRGFFEPFSGAILGPSIIIIVYFLSGQYDDRISMVLMLALYAIAGAVGGYVYYYINKKLENS